MTKCLVTFYLVRTTIPNYNGVSRMFKYTHLVEIWKSCYEVNQNYKCVMLFFSLYRVVRKGNLRRLGQNHVHSLHFMRTASCKPSIWPIPFNGCPHHRIDICNVVIVTGWCIYQYLHYIWAKMTYNTWKFPISVYILSGHCLGGCQCTSRSINWWILTSWRVEGGTQIFFGRYMF